VYDDDDETTLAMTVPLDSDGFLRRECPTCEREFKWLPSADDESSTPAPDGGYFCPYCGVQADSGSWLTKAQAELAQNLVAREVVGPMLGKFRDDLKRSNQRSGGFITMDLEYDEPDEADPLTESDDMARVDFECHPREPVKVAESWDKPIRCLICGAPNA